MTKTKSTKHALLTSTFALIICVSMLIGTTFAWFTDSVTSGSNKIVAGNLKLDLELYDTESKTWKSIKESKAPIFNYDLWEPGYTEVQLLKVENEGKLALRWYAKFISENNLSILADVIDVYVCPSENELSFPSDRNIDGYTKVGTVADFVNTIEDTTYGNLEAGEFAYLGIALKMRESTGNDYQGLDLGGAFDIVIHATQDTVENDSFDNQYDAEASHIGGLYSPNEVYAATVNGGKYSLGTDIKHSASEQSYSANRAYAVRDDKEYAIDLNGHTINYDKEYNGFIYLYTVAYNSTMIINGDGTIRVTNNSNGANAETCIAYAQSTGNIIINGGNFNPQNGIAAWAGGGAHITINGGSFISDGEKQCELIYSSGGVIDIYGGFFHNTTWEGRPVNVADANRNTGFINIYGGTFVNFDPSTGGNDPNNIRVADGYKVVSETQANGDIWYTVVVE